MKIGFIGLGHMGSGMAANLLKAGHHLTVYNRTPGKAQALVSQGARAASEVADACRGDAVITMLADDGAVEGVAFGNKGVIASLRGGATHISMSTISVALSRRLAAAHAKAVQRFVAAPVFGRPEAAAAGKLFIAAGGAPDAVDACTPLFQVLGQSTFRVGDKPQDANLVKLSGNFLFASVIESLGEAMALVSKADIDRHEYLGFLTSTLFPAPVYKTYGELIADGHFEPASFAAPLGFKDIRLTLAAAEGLRVPMPLASLLHDRFVQLLAQGGEALDWSAIGCSVPDDGAVYGGIVRRVRRDCNRSRRKKTPALQGFKKSSRCVTHVFPFNRRCWTKLSLIAAFFAGVNSATGTAGLTANQPATSRGLLLTSWSSQSGELNAVNVSAHR
jgi:3-hydroxyisobutyrate dehydrogenase-like beta-hydroxyacid dehydrogenase